MQKIKARRDVMFASYEKSKRVGDRQFYKKVAHLSCGHKVLLDNPKSTAKWKFCKECAA